MTSDTGLELPRYQPNTILAISALKGFNPKSATFRQHYYPEGGWGWIIAMCAVLVQVLPSGLQLSFGILYIHILRSFNKDAVMTTGERG